MPAIITRDITATAITINQTALVGICTVKTIALGIDSFSLAKEMRKNNEKIHVFMGKSQFPRRLREKRKRSVRKKTCNSVKPIYHTEKIDLPRSKGAGLKYCVVTIRGACFVFFACDPLTRRGRSVAPFDIIARLSYAG